MLPRHRVRWLLFPEGPAVLFGAVVDGGLVELSAILCFGGALVGELLFIGAEGEAAGRDATVGSGEDADVGGGVAAKGAMFEDPIRQ